MIKPTGINKKLHLVGGSLSFIIVSVITLTVIMNERSDKDSLIINIAGKQRMLTQKMSKEIFYIRHKSSHDFRELNAAVDLFENNLNDLINGNDVKGIYPPQSKDIKTKLKEVNALWIPFKDEIKNIEKNIQDAKSDLEVLVENTTTLLDKPDDIVQIMVKNKMRGKFIDPSGRQRMLSQRMGLFIERYLRTDNKEDYLHFIQARNLYDKTIKSFLADSEVKEIEAVHSLVRSTYAYWQKHDKYIKSLIEVEDSINDSVAYIYEKNIKLLNTMDDAVWLYTEYSEEKNDLFLRFQYISLLIGLVIMLYAYILSREVVSHLNDFVKKTKALSKGDLSVLNHENIELDTDNEDELKEASNNLSGFVKKVNSAMSLSDEAIKKAESAIEELQNLTDNVDEVLDSLNIDDTEKSKLDRSVNATEDIAIESAENLLHVKKMLQKLQANFDELAKKSNN